MYFRDFRSLLHPKYAVNIYFMSIYFVLQSNHYIKNYQGMESNTRVQSAHLQINRALSKYNFVFALYTSQNF